MDDRCKFCGKETNIIFNINFKAINVCQNCADLISLQNIQDVLMKRKLNIKKIEGLVSEIMQAGFEVAMGGDAFKTEEENKKFLDEKYDEKLKYYIHLISRLNNYGT